MDFVRLDLIAGRHRRGLFSINHNANTMLHTLSNNLTGKNLGTRIRCRNQVTTTCRF